MNRFDKLNSLLSLIYLILSPRWGLDWLFTNINDLC